MFQFSGFYYNLSGIDVRGFRLNDDTAPISRYDGTYLGFHSPNTSWIEIICPPFRSATLSSQTARGAGVCCKTFAQEGYCVLHEVRLTSAPF